MHKHPACIDTRYGYVEIDHDKKLVNNIVAGDGGKILDSDFFKNKMGEGGYWPRVEHSGGNVYKTEYIPNILRYPEFTPIQFKEALLFLHEVCAYCESNGMYIKTHLWNVTFYKGKPYLIDIRDFEVNTGQDWRCIFFNHFSDNISNHTPVHFSKFVKNVPDLPQINSLEVIGEFLRKLEPHTPGTNKWHDYHGNRLDFLTHAQKYDSELYNMIRTYGGGSGISTKSEKLFELVDKLEPTSVIEMGCNNGIYTFGLSNKCTACGIDYDLSSINMANSINTRLNRDCSFLHMDLFDDKLETSYGLNGSYGTIYSRFVSDVLVAPAVLHHLYRHCNSFDIIIDIFGKFTRRAMVLEVIPDHFDSAKLEASLTKKGWKIVETTDSSPSPRNWITVVKSDLLDDFLKLEKPATFRYWDSRPRSVINNHIYTTVKTNNNHKIVGYGHLDKEQDRVWLGICVLEQYQGMGYGKKIMEELLENRGNCDLYLTVDKDNYIARKLYESFGFKLIKEDTVLYLKNEYKHTSVSG